LDVAEWNAGVEGSGDERVTERVWPDALGDPGPSGDAAHDPPGGVTVDPCTVGADEDRAVAAFTDCQVDGPGGAGRQGDGDDLAAFAQDRERAVPRSSPRSSMSAPMASETRSPLRASRLIRA
jgi:hypothetical protein